MKISTEISSFRPYGENRDVLRLLKEGGFDAYDFSMFRGDRERLIDEPHYLRGAEKLREYGESIGISCNQTHAPFPTVRPGDEAFNAVMFDEIVRAIEVSGALGAAVLRGRKAAVLLEKQRQVPVLGKAGALRDLAHGQVGILQEILDIGQAHVDHALLERRAVQLPDDAVELALAQVDAAAQLVHAGVAVDEAVEKIVDE